MEEKQWQHNYILLCDDDEDDRFFFKDVINELNDKILVKSVNNYDQLHNELNTHHLPDILFLDLNMPGKTGLDCIEMIKTQQQHKKFPIVIYSTSATKSDLEETYIKGANLCMQKAINIQTLKKNLTRVLQTTSQTLLNINKTEFFFENGD